LNALQSPGWEKINAGDISNDSAIIWEGNKLLLENEQKVVLQPIFDMYSSDIDKLDLLGFKLHHSPSQIAQQMSLIPATKPTVPGTPFFREAMPGGSLSNSGDRWNWISNFMLPAFERFEGSTSMRVQLRDMTTFPVPIEVFK